MSEIKIDDICVGSVSKFAGNPPARRWIAFSIHRPQPDVENTRGFATRKAAYDWLEAEHNLKELKGSNNEDGNY